MNLGRRVLRMHLTLFLSTSLASSPLLLSKFLSQNGIDKLLETKELGAGAGRAWKLEDVIRWREVNGADGLPTGLFKSRGTALEAIVGAVYLAHVSSLDSARLLGANSFGWIRESKHPRECLVLPFYLI